MKKQRSGPFDAKFAKLVKETLDKWHVPGISIAVVDGDDMWAEVTPLMISYTLNTHQGMSDSTIPTYFTFLQNLESRSDS